MTPLLRQFRDFFVSLKLTVVLLALSIVLIFWATLAQVQLGIWGVQQKFFHAFFVLEKIPGTAIPVPVFPGDTGGLLANLNRWRGQISLPPFTPDQLDANIQHLDIGSLHVDVVDFAGTANGAPTRILGAVVPKGGETWFFKLMGPDALVAAQKQDFLAFLNSVKESAK